MKNKGQILPIPAALAGFVCSIVFGFAFLSSGRSAIAQTCVPASFSAGSLDTCFGIGGRVTSNFGSGHNIALDMVIQPLDDKIVVVGSLASNPTSTARDALVLRYETDGSLDQTFGSNGAVRVSFTTWDDLENANAVAVQPDGKIIIAGNASVSGRSTVNGFAIARLNANGSLDSSFGTNGKLLFNFSSKTQSLALDIAIQNNGYIVVAGRCDLDFALVRLTTTGNFDPAFNGTGKTVIQTARATDVAAGAYGVAIQTVFVGGIPQDKIVAVGFRPTVSGKTSTGRDFAVLRLNPNGSLDTSFGSGGKVFTDFSLKNDEANRVAIDTDNNIVVVGRTTLDGTLAGYRFALVRYTPNGMLDPSFGSGGQVTAGPIGYFDALRRLKIQSDGKLVTGGTVKSPDGGPFSELAISRFNVLGSPDTTFGSDGTGTVLTDFYGQKEDLYGLALQSDGKIVAIGGTMSPYYIVLARYMP